MPASDPLEFSLDTPEATADLARRIAPRLAPGDVLLLEGPIGAGKTHFARALIKARMAAAGYDEDVPSPTFTLVQTYDVDGASILHADLYRLHDAHDAVELGLEDGFAEAICLVEWPDRLGTVPDGAITLVFGRGAGPDARQLRITSGQARWREVLSAENTVAG